jgi:hypothetical protein
MSLQGRETFGLAASFRISEKKKHHIGSLKLKALGDTLSEKVVLCLNKSKRLGEIVLNATSLLRLPVSACLILNPASSTMQGELTKDLKPDFAEMRFGILIQFDITTFTNVARLLPY